MLLLSARALAADLFVPTDHTSLAEAVAASASGDTIWIEGSYEENVGNVFIAIPHALTIRGYGDRPLLRGGTPEEGVFLLALPVSEVVRFEHLRFDGENTTPFLDMTGGFAYLTDVLLENGHRETAGGLLRLTGVPGDVIVVADSELAGGSAPSGGIAAVYGGTLSVHRSTLRDSDATVDGGLVYGQDASISLSRSSLLRGESEDRGGAIFLQGEGALSTDRCTLSENRSGAGGGAVFTFGISPLYDFSWFIDNETDGVGGAIAMTNGGGGPSGSVFCGNSALRGGAYSAAGGSLVAMDSVFLENEADQQGGAILASRLDADHLSISSSRALVGAALFTEQEATVIDSYIADHDGIAVGGTLDSTDLSFSSFWNNEIDYDPLAADVSDMQFGDSLVPPGSGCDPALMIPPAGSPLLGNASAAGDIGAYGGYYLADWDGDGVIPLYDCDEEEIAIFPGAPEIVGNGQDDDCDDDELCYADTDGDGRGEDSTVVSADLDCYDPGEFIEITDICVGFDDTLDADSDGVPDGCEIPEEEPEEEEPQEGAPPREPEEYELAGGTAGCGCAQARPSAGWLLALALLLRRRARA